MWMCTGVPVLYVPISQTNIFLIMKYDLVAVHIRLDNGKVITQRIKGQTNDLSPLRQVYKDLYGAESVMFTYNSHEKV